jgi:hypothetical protein
MMDILVEKRKRNYGTASPIEFQFIFIFLTEWAFSIA